MLKIYKVSERVLKVSLMIKALKDIGSEVKQLGEFMKWKELDDGSRLSVSMTLYQIKTSDRVAYFFSDVLGRLACEAFLDVNDGYDWLRKHGYKTDHDFYIQDYGMTEETWQEWNK